MAGVSRYANPYADKIERREAQTTRSKLSGNAVPVAPIATGWLYGFLHAWWDGWNAADILTSP